MKYYNLGTILDGKHVFRLLEEELNTHLAILGTTGGGKSRLLWQLLREHRRNRRGFCAIDPGDLIEDFLADCAREVLNTGNTALLQKIHLVELSPFQLARYDAFRFFYPKWVHPELMDTVFRSFQHTKVQGTAEVFHRKQGQTSEADAMVRLQRNFINVFTALSTLVEGKRLALGDAHLLIDLGHPWHQRTYERLKGHLPREIVADFEVLHSIKSVRDLRTEMESCLNRIRSMLGPLMKRMLSGNGSMPALDLYQIIQRGDYLLVKVAKTPFASSEQNVALASLFIHDVIETMLITPRDLRRPFTLAIDEAHQYLGPDIGEIARTARKHLLALVLGTTDLASLRKGDLDLAPELLSVVNTVIAFRMTWPDDVERLTKFLYAQNLEFKELIHEVERRAGHEWFQVDERSETFNRQRSRGRTSAVTATHTESAQHTRAQALARSSGTTHGPGGQLVAAMQGTNAAESGATSAGTASTAGTQDGVQEGETEGYGVTVHHKLVLIEKIVRELQKTGMLEHSVADQLARFGQILSGHARRRATARVREQKAVEIESLEVKDPFLSAEAQVRAVEWVKRELYALHPYYFTPSVSPEEETRRLEEFLGATAPEHVVETGDMSAEDEEEIDAEGTENPFDG